MGPSRRDELTCPFLAPTRGLIDEERMWCRRPHARPEVLELYVMRVLSGESIAVVSREAGISYRTLQLQLLRARERNAKLMMGNGHGRRGHSGHTHGYDRQEHEPDGALNREEANRVRPRQLQEQQQRELLPFQDQYIYEIHRAPSDERDSSELMEVDDTFSALETQVEGAPRSGVIDDGLGAADTSEWATEGESYPRKRRKTERWAAAPVICM